MESVATDLQPGKGFQGRRWCWSDPARDQLQTRQGAGLLADNDVVPCATVWRPWLLGASE